MTASEEALESAFKTIDSHYGSFDNYRRNGLGLSDSEVMRLKERLLER
jgi:protein-tyrosine phosphatase